jgi:hypothetical protein
VQPGVGAPVAHILGVVCAEHDDDDLKEEGYINLYE